MEAIEERVHKAVEAEVDTLFHGIEPHEKSKIVETAKEKVQKSASKVKDQTEKHDFSQNDLPFAHSQFPYDWPHEDPNHRILHAVESAEKAVLHAVEEEVALLFHGLDEGHEDADATKRTEAVLKKGVKKTQKQMKAGHQKRRENYSLSIQAAHPLDEESDPVEQETFVQRMIEDFLQWDME